MHTLRSITGLFVVSLFAFAAGCSADQKEGTLGESAQSLLAPCECPTVVGNSSDLLPPCECEPEEPGDEPGDEPACPPGEHEECSVKAPGGVSSLLAPPECVCVPDEICPPHAVQQTVCDGIIAPAGALSIWGGASGCVTQCVSLY